MLQSMLYLYSNPECTLIPVLMTVGCWLQVKNALNNNKGSLSVSGVINL